MKDKDELNDLKKDRMGSAQQMRGKQVSQSSYRPALASAPKEIAEHTVSGGETLSHISLKYYGSATKPHWMVIYEANKALIGDNPNRLKRGITLKIPELPAELKK